MTKNSRTPAALQSQVEPIVLARIVIRRWGVIAAVLGAILATAAVAATIYVWEPVYDAKQFVQVMQNREFTDIIVESGKKTDAKEILANLDSEYLLNQLLQDEELLKLRPDVDVKKLQRMVRHEGAGGELYAIICRDESPKFAALVTEKLSTKFVNFHRADREKNLQELMATLDQQIAEDEIVLKGINSQLEALNNQKLMPKTGASRNDPVFVDESYMNQIREGLRNEEFKFEQLTLQVEKLKTALDNVEQQYTESEESGIIANIKTSPSIVSIESHLRELEFQKSNLNNLGSTHPKIAEFNRLIKRTEDDLQTTQERQLASSRAAWINSRKSEIDALIEQNEQQLGINKSKIEDFEEEIKRLNSAIREQIKWEFEMQQLEGEKEAALFQLAERNEQKNRIQSKDMSIYPVKLLDEDKVTLPTEPVERYPFKLLGIVSIAAFLLPFAAAFAWEFHLRRISSPAQIENQLPIQLVGEVTRLPARSRRSAALTSKQGLKQLRLYEESVDNLSAILSHAASRKIPLIMSVTSAASNEGKTTLSSQLAISAARSHLGRTLLIDADLRSPSLHRVFDRSLENGLADVLSGKLTLNDSISQTDIENLDLLTAGKIRNSPRRYFTGTFWPDLLALAGQDYDHVIVDTPPVLAASESLAISKSCDFALICILRDVSRTASVKLAYDRLVSADVKVIGCALGGIPQNEYSIRYGNYGYNMS